MKLFFILLLFPFTLCAQGYRSAGVLSSGKAHGAYFTLHHQATDLWSVGLSAEVLKGKTTTAALVMVNHFTTDKLLFTFAIGHTVYPSHGAFVEGGAGVYLGRVVVSLNYRHCAAMPRTEGDGEARGVKIMESGVFARAGLEF